MSAPELCRQFLKRGRGRVAQQERTENMEFRKGCGNMYVPKPGTIKN